MQLRNVYMWLSIHWPTAEGRDTWRKVWRKRDATYNDWWE